MAVDYYTYYDFLKDPYSFWFGIGGVSVCLLGTLVFFRAARLAPRTEESERKKTFYFLGLVALCVTIGFIWSQVVSYQTDSYLRDALRENRVNMVEGEIKNFVPMPGGGHAQESFSVQNQNFNYSEFVISPGFRKTIARGGSILKNGMRVRIAYLGNHILRLEIAKD